jgi:hypothetical protein
MADLFQYTDEDGAKLNVRTRKGGDLLVAVTDEQFRASAVDLPEVDGRRLLAKLQAHYARLDGRSHALPDELEGLPR